MPCLKGYLIRLRANFKVISITGNCFYLWRPRAVVRPAIPAPTISMLQLPPSLCEYVKEKDRKELNDEAEADMADT